MRPNPLPTTYTSIDPGSLVISYDFEGTRGKENYENGSSMSLGAAAFSFPSGLLAPVPQPLFLQNIISTVPMDTIREEWWDNHRDAYDACLVNQVERAIAADRFLNWLADLNETLNTGLPIVLLSSPHKYDGQHMIDLLTEGAAITGKRPTMHSLQRRRALPPFLYADVGDLLGGLTKRPEQEAKANFKHFMPEELFHIPHLDSIEQGLAFFRALKSLNYGDTSSKVVPFTPKKR